MAIHASPGVYFETIDLSLYTPKLSTTSLALVGKTAKGSTEPTLFTNVRSFIDAYGTPRRGDFSALAAMSYLEYGNTLWYKRLVGIDATSAKAEIPRAVSIDNELLATADNTGRYIFNATLNEEPVPGTIELKVSHPNTSDNFIVIKDIDNGNGTGVFSPYLNNSISNYPNFIDYDTGELRFTLSEEIETLLTAGSTRTVITSYNNREYPVTNETARTITAVSTTGSYFGVLKYQNVINSNDFKLVINSANGETYTFGITAPSATPGTYELTGTDENDNVVSGIGSVLTVDSGYWKIVFDGTHNLQIGDVVLASYKHSVVKQKTLGTLGEEYDTNLVYGLSYIDSINNVIYPGTVNIIIQESDDNGIIGSTTVAVDNGSGRFIPDPALGGSTQTIINSTNTVDYVSRNISFALIAPPEENYVISVSYMAKYTENIYVAEVASLAEDGLKTLSTKLTFTPIIKEQVTVFIKDKNHILVDDGTGSFKIYKSVDSLGQNDFVLDGNVTGSIDYDTGIIEINLLADLDVGDVVGVSYLSKFADIKALGIGSYYNGIKLEFYKDNYYGYGLRIWNSEQIVSQTADEDWKDITFVNSEKPDYFENKIISSLIQFENAIAPGISVPVFNNIITLSGGFDDADNITASVAIAALETFANTETIDVNLMACPDFPGNKAVIAALINICEIQRGECFAIVDPPQNLNVQDVVNWHNGDGKWANENAINSSFVALYYPWIQILNIFSESLQWVPPSVKVVSAFAYNDSVGEVWGAPAGLNRGRLTSVLQVERILTIGERDLMYATSTNCINPICDFVGDGIVIYGQKTAQRMPSALDRVNVMRMIIYVSKILATAVKYLLFEPNDSVTWLQYRQIIQPYLEDIKSRRGLYEFKIVCDESTNTAYHIDNNTLVAEIYLRPTKTSEKIITRFIISNSGATFDSLNTAAGNSA